MMNLFTWKSDYRNWTEEGRTIWRYAATIYKLMYYNLVMNSLVFGVLDATGFSWWKQAIPVEAVSGRRGERWCLFK